MAKHIEIEDEVHARLSEYGNLSETYSDAILRAIEEATDEGA